MPRKLSDREKSFLKLLNAYPTINSGATFSDGDGYIRNNFVDYAIEVKATDNKSYTLKLETWKKIEHEANRIGHEAIMGIDIQGKRLIILDVNEFMEILEVINQWKPK